MHDQISDATLGAHSNEDEEISLALPKPIIKASGDVINNMNKTGIGYKKEVTFHIPNYSKPIQL